MGSFAEHQPTKAGLVRRRTVHGLPSRCSRAGKVVAASEGVVDNRWADDHPRGRDAV